MALQGVHVFRYTANEENERGAFSIVEEACRLLTLLAPTKQEADELQSGKMGIRDFFAFKKKIILNFTTRMYDPMVGDYTDHTFLMIPNPASKKYKQR